MDSNSQLYRYAIPALSVAFISWLIIPAIFLGLVCADFEKAGHIGSLFGTSSALFTAVALILAAWAVALQKQELRNAINAFQTQAELTAITTLLDSTEKRLRQLPDFDPIVLILQGQKLIQMHAQNVEIHRRNHADKKKELEYSLETLNETAANKALADATQKLQVYEIATHIVEERAILQERLAAIMDTLSKNLEKNLTQSPPML